MENKKYKVKRDNIYVGEVIQTSTIYRYMKNTRYNDDDDDTRLGVFSAYGCRSMLFVPDANNYAGSIKLDEYLLPGITNQLVLVTLTLDTGDRRTIKVIIGN